MPNRNINTNQVLVGQPLDYPTGLVLLMKSIFDTRKDVIKAYLACVQYPDPKLAPKILVGVEVSGEFEKISSHLTVLLKNENIDINQLVFTDALNGPFKNYFSKIKPFYSLNI